jgi:uncharacterized delta-60 repeat protein
MRTGRAIAIVAAAGVTGCSLVVGGEDRSVGGNDASEDRELDGSGLASNDGAEDSSETLGDATFDAAGEAASLDSGDAAVGVPDATLDAPGDAGADSPSDAKVDAAPNAQEAGIESGSLDQTFGKGGIVLTPTGASDAVINALAIDSAGNIVAGGYSYAGAMQVVTVARYTTAGVLDPTFGTAGVATRAVGSISSSANAVMVDANGIVSVGPASSTGVDNGNSHIGLARFTSSGASDGTFGSAGSRVVSNGPGFPEIPYAATRLTDGRFTVVARVQDNTGVYAEVARFTTAGAPDTTTCNSPYGYQWQYFTPKADEVPYAVALIDPSTGTVVHAGSAANLGTGGAAYALRTLSDCTLDNPFGTTYDFTSGNDYAKAVAFSGNQYFLAGVANAGGGAASDVFVARLTAAGCPATPSSCGVLDTTFGAAQAGSVITDIDGGQDDGRGLAIDTSGDIVVAGVNANPAGTNSQVAVLRYTPSGSLDTSFGTAGIVVVQLGDPSVANAVVLQGDGKIVVGGYATIAGHKQFALVRLNR